MCRAGGFWAGTDSCRRTWNRCCGNGQLQAVDWEPFLQEQPDRSQAGSNGSGGSNGSNGSNGSGGSHGSRAEKREL